MGGRIASAEVTIPAVPAPASRDAVVRLVERSLVGWERPEDVLKATSFARAATEAAAPPGPRELSALPAPGTSRQDPPVFRFDIPPGPLSGALRQFEKLTRISVRVSDELVRSLTSRGVQGLLTAEDALRQILADSSLSYRFTSVDTVVVEVRPVSEDVRVTATASLPAVSSPKLTTPLLDTPQTVVVVSRAVIEEQGATTLRDVLRNVPGITMQAGEGGGGLPGDTLTLRGFSATNDIFVDGVRDVAPYSRDAFNLEQVEVMKGPSSAFGGRGSTGGAINLATKSAALASIRQGTVGVGSAGYQRTTVDLNEPIGGTSTAVRLNAMWQDAGVPGRDVVNNRGWGVAPAVGIGLTGRTRVNLSSQHVSQDNVPDYGLPWGTSTDPDTGEVFPTGAFRAEPAVDQSNFYGLVDYDFEDIRSHVATARVDHDVQPGFTLRNVARYGETSRQSAITAPRPPNRQLQRRDMRNEVFANQASLSATFATGGVAHEVAAGVEAARELTATENSAQNTNQPQTRLRAPDPTDRPFDVMPPLAGNPLRTVTRTVGAYLFDTLNLTPEWQLTAGLRWDRSDVDFRQTTGATGAIVQLGRVDAMLSWRGGIVYKPRPNGSIYVGYGTSFIPAAEAGNTGAALSAAENAANNVNLEPERSRNVEAGTKWNVLGNRLAVTGAIFRTEKTNARTRDLNNEPFVLAGRQRVQGIELGLTGRVAGGWTAFAAYTFMDSAIVDTANAGRDLALTPEHSASFWLNGSLGRRLSAGAGAQYTDGVFRNTTTDLRVPGYWIANATAAYAINSHLTLRVNANNLTNTRYVDRVGGGHYIPGPGRSVQVTTSVEF
jgi:catecholate siderophore receptor